MKLFKYLGLALLVIASALISYYLYNQMYTTVTDDDAPDVEEVLKAELSFSQELMQISTKDEDGEAVEVVLDAKLYEVPAADVKIKFDPEYVEVLSVEKGDFESFAREEIDNENGYISLSVTSNLDDMFTGEGTLAKLNVKVKQVGETKLELTEGESGIDTYVSAVGGDKIPLQCTDLSVTATSESVETEIPMEYSDTDARME